MNNYVYSGMLYSTQTWGKNNASAALMGVLRVLQHPGPQFWTPAIGGSEKYLRGVYNWNL